MRKEIRYQELVEIIKENNWNVELLTIEVGARGLIGNRTFRALVKRGDLRSAKLFQSLSPGVLTPFASPKTAVNGPRT